MTIETTSDFPPAQLIDFDELKFVVFDRNGERKIVLLDEGRAHISALSADAILVGAGRVKKDGEINWGSLTCKKARGYDRPKDPQQAEKTLAEIQAEIAAWKKY